MFRVRVQGFRVQGLGGAFFNIEWRGFCVQAAKHLEARSFDVHGVTWRFMVPSNTISYKCTYNPIVTQL